MAINKNFVIKNGVEVNTSLIVGDATLNKVGVGTTVPGYTFCLLYTSPSPRDQRGTRMPSSA